MAEDLKWQVRVTFVSGKDQVWSITDKERSEIETSYAAKVIIKRDLPGGGTAFYRCDLVEEIIFKPLATD